MKEKDIFSDFESIKNEIKDEISEDTDYNVSIDSEGEFNPDNVSLEEEGETHSQPNNQQNIGGGNDFNQYADMKNDIGIDYSRYENEEIAEESPEIVLSPEEIEENAKKTAETVIYVGVGKLEQLAQQFAKFNMNKLRKMEMKGEIDLDKKLKYEGEVITAREYIQEFNEKITIGIHISKETKEGLYKAIYDIARKSKTGGLTAEGRLVVYGVSAVFELGQSVALAYQMKNEFIQVLKSMKNEEQEESQEIESERDIKDMENLAKAKARESMNEYNEKEILDKDEEDELEFIKRKIEEEKEKEYDLSDDEEEKELDDEFGDYSEEADNDENDIDIEDDENEKDDSIIEDAIIIDEEKYENGKGNDDDDISIIDINRKAEGID